MCKEKVQSSPFNYIYLTKLHIINAAYLFINTKINNEHMVGYFSSQYKKWEAVTDVDQLPPIFKSYLSIFNFYFSASPLAVVGQ